MLTQKFVSYLMVLLFGSVLLIGCKDMGTESVQTPETTTEKMALEKIAQEDSSLVSFEKNYDEQGGLDFSLGKTAEQIFPVRVVRRVTNVTRNFDANIIGDTSYVTATLTFSGNLFIAASYDSVALGDSSAVDTIIVKPFSSTVVRKLIFSKVANTRNPEHNWKLIAISLPDGGTVTQNIKIQKMTISLPNDTLVITSPNDYYLSRGLGKMRQIPLLNRNQRVTIYVEIFSKYDDEDFVTLTFGADIRGINRVKRKLTLESSIPVSDGFVKTFKHTFLTQPFPGHSHAIVSAMPKQVVFDDQAPVECKSWGIPYFVR
ncbi:MAG TPA: hypothetical protein PK559_04365 [Ignavibacteriaceae bacterium]|nr:hypothetical protein [Ignavibacteriaceae bacterium]